MKNGGQNGTETVYRSEAFIEGGPMSWEDYYSQGGYAESTVMYEKEHGAYYDYNFEAGQEVLEQLTRIVDEYYTTYGKEEYSVEQILNGADSIQEKISALTTAITTIGANEGLDYGKARGDYSKYLENAENGNIQEYINQLLSEGDINGVLSLYGSEGLNISDMYQAHENRMATDSEYRTNVEQYGFLKARADYANTTHLVEGEYPPGYEDSLIQMRDCGDKVQPVIGLAEHDWGDGIYEVSDRIRWGLEKYRNPEQEQSKETEQNNEQKTIWDTIKEKISGIGDYFSGIFNGSKKFEQEVVSSAQTGLSDIGEQIRARGQNVLEEVQQFIDENVTGKTESVGENTRGSLTELREKVLGERDLGEKDGYAISDALRDIEEGRTTRRTSEPDQEQDEPYTFHIK